MGDDRPNLADGTAIHDLITLLEPYARATGGTLRTAPQDVFFPGADPVQPDIFAILPGNPGRRVERGFAGAPDLVVDVLSPSTRGREGLTTRTLYARPGVREYWLVDPDARAVEILALDGDVLREAWTGRGEDAVRSRLLPKRSFPASAVVAEPDIG